VTQSRSKSTKNIPLWVTGAGAIGLAMGFISGKLFMVDEYENFKIYRLILHI